MELSAETRDDIIILSPKGNINRATSPSLEAKLKPLVEAGQDIIVDLSEAATVSSAGLRVLFIIAKAAGEQGQFILAAPNEMVADILNVTGFSSLITVRDSVDEALGLIRG